MVSLFNTLLSMVSIILILSSLFSYNYGFFKAAQAHSITIPVRGDGPLGIAYNPVNSNMYVANLGSSTVSVINSSTDSVTSSILVGKGPAWIAHAPLSNKLYVTSSYHNDVYVINGTTNKVIKNIPVGTSAFPSPWAIAYNPSNNNVYVANAGDGTVSIINASTDTVVGTIAFVLPIMPFFLTYDSSNQGMYVTTGVGGQGNIKVSIINTATNAHVGDSFFPAGIDSRTFALAYNRNNNLIYVTAFDTSSIA